MSYKKIIYFGTPQFAADVLIGLFNVPNIRVELVVTGSAKTRGRHSEVPTPVTKTAHELGLTVFETDSPKNPELLSRIQAIQPDLGVIVAWRILPEEVYAAPRLGTINLHGSLLPKYRGAAPIQRAIWNDEHETGLTVFLLDRGIDTGNVLLSRTLSITPLDTAGDLFKRFAPVGVELLRDAIHGLAEGKLTPQQQPNEIATSAAKIKPDERWIDWTKSAANIRCQIHALSPEPAAVTKLDATRVLLFRVHESDCNEASEPGKIVVEKRGFRIGTGVGWLSVDEAAREGKKIMSGEEFARGIQQWNGAKFLLYEQS